MWRNQVSFQGPTVSTGLTLKWLHDKSLFMLMLIKMLITILMLLCTSVTFFHQNVNENKMLIKLFSSATSPPAVRWWALLASTIGGLLSSHFVWSQYLISYDHDIKAKNHNCDIIRDGSVVLWVRLCIIRSSCLYYLYCQVKRCGGRSDAQCLQSRRWELNNCILF